MRSAIDVEEKTRHSADEPGETDGRFDAYRLLWWAVVLVPATLWLALALAYWGFRPKPLDSGDPLLDKYLDAVIRQSAEVNPAKRDMYGFAAAWSDCFDIDAADLGQWPAEFRDDPRFWLLASHQATELSAGIVAVYNSEQKGVNAYYLDEAHKRGVVCPALLLRLLATDVRSWERLGYGQIDFDYRQRQNDPASFYQTLWQVVSEQHGREYQDLLQELLALAPEEALPYYFSAIVSAKQGQYEQALSSISAGNRAKNCSLLLGFPYELGDSESWLSGRIADKYISRQFCFRSINARVYIEPNEMQEVVGLLVQYATTHDDPASLTELKNFICRLARIHSAYRRELGSGELQDILKRAKQHYNYWSRPAAGTSAKSGDAVIRALDEFDQALSALDTALVNISNQQMTSWSQLSGWQRFTNDCENLLSFNSRQEVVSGDSGFAYLQERQRYIEQSVLPVLDKVESFDFETLTWREP